MRMTLPLACIAIASCAAENPNLSSHAVIEPIESGDGAFIGWMLSEFGSETRYRAGDIDLDGDGIDETLLYIGSRNFCGSGGCDLYVMRMTTAGVEVLSRSTITRLPIGVMDTSTNGMRDIAVNVGGGGLDPGIRVLRFDGEGYPLNPTTDGVPADSLGEIVISEGPLRPLLWRHGPVEPPDD